MAVAHQAERLGFESMWLFDHFQTMPVPRDELAFEAFTSLSALAVMTRRVRLGHLVLCAGYRNPALVAKMIGTLDVVSGGRLELGLGAGWKQDEWLAYGYGFPPLKERLALLADSLEVTSRMLSPGRAAFAGRLATVDEAINLPKGLQSPRVPIVVGGNGPEVTFRLAARYADELNLDGLAPRETRDALRVIAARCEEIGREPATLKVSVHVDRGIADQRDQRRQENLSAYATSVSRASWPCSGARQTPTTRSPRLRRT